MQGLSQLGLLAGLRAWKHHYVTSSYYGSYLSHSDFEQVGTRFALTVVEKSGNVEAPSRMEKRQPSSRGSEGTISAQKFRESKTVGVRLG